MEQFYSGNNRSLLEKVAAQNQVDKPLSDDAQVIVEFVIEKKERKDFQMERGVMSSGIKTLVCKLCGSDRFMVGQDDYFTAIKCLDCGYELGVHEG